jgi:drug/metabolite transporter (DMT)-like permease
MLSVIALYALFSLTFSAGKKALAYSGPMGLTWIRMLVTAGTLLPVYFVQKRKLPKMSWYQFGLLFLYSLATLAAFLFANMALAQVSSIKVALFYTLAPFITALISSVVYHERLNLLKSIGMLLGFAGILMIILYGADSSQLTLEWPGLPEMMLLIAITAYSVSWFIIRPLVTEKRFSPLFINGSSTLIGTIICTSAMYFSNTPFPTALPFWQWGGLQAVMSSVICYSLYMHLLNYYSPNFLAFASFMEPIFATVYGWILLGEVPSIAFWLASIVVSFGLYLFYRGEQKIT